MGEIVGYGQQYGALLQAIAEEADAIAMRYFRADELRVDRKGDGTAVTQADRDVEEMARAKVARSGRAFGGFWQHMLVAEGAVEVAVDLTSKPWDLAPLGIIVEEAGGRSTNLRGERTIYTGQLVSTNGKIHDEVLKILG